MPPNRFGKLRLLKLKSKEKDFHDAFESYVGNDIYSAYDRGKFLYEVKEGRRNRNVNIILVVLTFVMAAATWASVYFAVINPQREKEIEDRKDKENKIVLLYRNINVNTDIFIDNINELKNLDKINDDFVHAPSNYMSGKLDLEISEELQQNIGIINYRFLLYYIEQTEMLDQKIDDIKYKFLNGESYKADVEVYTNLMNYLSTEGWKNTKFNYQEDSECLLYILQKAFSYTEKDERYAKISCRADSLNRIYYHFGYLEPGTPEWIKNDMKNALKERGIDAYWIN